MQRKLPCKWVRMALPVTPSFEQVLANRPATSPSWEAWLSACRGVSSKENTSQAGQDEHGQQNQRRASECE